ncbi:SRPBCC family protein [Streptomyces sp. RK75]|uniref:SRPBCC family protein n=1 Tax=Streptomyces sp. RK75 TaxID=2824895 RepID=UPI001B39C534|nr:SRPBCC family protein [Streptomyces sp. RK75]MBQ0866261.1 SRPBCC family protein [Streptomyces sp. RK75]
MADTRTQNGGGKPLGGLDPEATDRLKSAAQEFALAEGEKLLAGVGRKLGQATSRLNDVAEGKSPGFGRLALDSGRKIVEGKGPVRTAVEVGAGRLKEKAGEGIKGLLGAGDGKRKGSGGQKPVVILEYVDVGVPVRTAYDQWTQLQDFSSFTKGVRDVTVADDTTSDWKAKIFWSDRSWQATTTEQIPDQRIAWTSEGAKGSTKGVVTFHELTGNLTRVVLLIEYYPKGLFEKTGNIWRAQGRRARLDLKHYVRHISMKGEADEGWRGEIRDGEVVVTHEDAVAEEERRAEDAYEDAYEDEDRTGTEADVGEADDADDAEEPEQFEDSEQDAYEEPADRDEAEEEFEEDDPEAEYADEPEEFEEEDASAGERR